MGYARWSKETQTFAARGQNGLSFRLPFEAGDSVSSVQVRERMQAQLFIRFTVFLDFEIVSEKKCKYP